MARTMTSYQWLAFVIAPLAVTAFGWTVVLLHDRYQRERHRQPGE